MSPKSDPRITIEFLAEKFPRTFFVNGGERKPLKIGIIRDLVDAHIGIPGTQLRHTLAAYTSSPGYLRACREGADRIDLVGEPVGIVSGAEAEHACRKLAVLEARWGVQEARQRVLASAGLSKTVSQAAPPQAPLLAPTERRLNSFADLKVAWLRRQAKRVTT
jgi:ProP effector